jgi:hypothetical protein
MNRKWRAPQEETFDLIARLTAGLALDPGARHGDLDCSGRAPSATAAAEDNALLPHDRKRLDRSRFQPNKIPWGVDSDQFLGAD